MCYFEKKFKNVYYMASDKLGSYKSIFLISV